SAEGCGDRARGEVVAGRRAAEEHLDVRVRVDRARDHVLPGRVDHPVGGLVERLADQPDPAVLGVDVVVGRRHDPATLDQNGHTGQPLSSEETGFVYNSPPPGSNRCQSVSRWNASAAARATPSSPARPVSESATGSPSTKPQGTTVTGRPSRAAGEWYGMISSR